MTALFEDPRLPRRFWDKVQPEPNSGCWLWSACVNERGYGRFGVRHDGTWLAHRAAFAFLVSANLGDLFVCHRCDNPSCVRPDHLFLGTHQDNVTDMVVKARHKSGPGFAANAAKTHCLRGHPLTDARIYRGSRVCRTCSRLQMRRQRAARKLQRSCA